MDSYKYSLITMMNISKSFSSRKVLDKLNLVIYSQEILLLVGRSGCGKSTFFKILMGMYPQDSGQIFFGKNIIQKTWNEKLKYEVGFVTQDNSFYEKLSCFENLDFFASMYGIPKIDAEFKINELLKLVKLTQARDIIAENLSGGMKRRLEFAISLIYGPNILILDEPFTGLDIISKNILWAIIHDIKSRGVTIILASHQLKGIEKNIDRVAILHEKKIIKSFYIQENSKIDLENYVSLQLQ